MLDAAGSKMDPLQDTNKSISKVGGTSGRLKCHTCKEEEKSAKCQCEYQGERVMECRCFRRWIFLFNLWRGPCQSKGKGGKKRNDRQTTMYCLISWSCLVEQLEESGMRLSLEDRERSWFYLCFSPPKSTSIGNKLKFPH